MKNLLMKYMEERFRGEALPLTPQKAGPLPVVTISRETGCSGTTVAVKLVQQLNQLQAGRKDKKEWKVINCRSFSADAIAEVICKLMETKNLIRGEK